MKKLILKINVEIGSGSYKGHLLISVSKKSDDIIIGRAIQHKYVKAAHIDRKRNKVKLLKEGSNQDFYTEEHKLERIEKVK